MASSKPARTGHDRLPLILGFQKLSDQFPDTTRIMEHGEGIYIYDSAGKEYLEATASFYVASLGYQHGELIDAALAQYRRLPFYVAGMHKVADTSIALAEALRQRVPILDAHVVFATSGSEASDFLLKLLMFQSQTNREPNRRHFIARTGSYHGGTLGAASLTGGHHVEFGLPLPGFHHVSQPDYHGLREPGESATAFGHRLATELDQVLGHQLHGKVAGFFAEPVSFSAGLAIPPSNYFTEIAEVLAAHDVPLVIDEVVTGFGRTGHLFGSETFCIEPTHLTMAKGITSGYFPLSAIAIGPALYAALERGADRVGTLAHAGTYAAHPVGAAVALKTLEIIERDGLVEHARRMGERLKTRLEPLREHPLVGDVRTMGLAGALDFLKRDDEDQPVTTHADALCHRVYEHALDLGLIIRPTGRCAIVAPPLITQASEIDEIGRRLERALDLTLSAFPETTRQKT